MAQLIVMVDQKTFLETFYRMLSMLEPDRTTDSGKRDLELKREIDSLINYLLTSKQTTDQSAYPSTGMSRG